MKSRKLQFFIIAIALFISAIVMLVLGFTQDMEILKYVALADLLIAGVFAVLAARQST